MSEKKTYIYMDFAAATPIDQQVLAAMRAHEDTHTANPRSLHGPGRAAREALENARADIARRFNVAADEIEFTSGGSDGNTRALHGVINALQDSGRELSTMHIIVSAIEHQSLRSCTELLSRRGVAVSYAPVTQQGVIDVKALEALIKENTVLVSVMLANNEIGTLQPVKEIVAVVRRAAAARGGLKINENLPLVHTDASQAALSMYVDLKDLGVDLATFDAQKVYGPSGVGALYVRNGTPYAGLCGALHKPDRDGGGTPNVRGAVGLAKALEVAEARRTTDREHFEKLREYMLSRLRERFSEVRINGEGAPNVGGILNVTFPGSEGEYLVTQMSERGIAVSSKSACLSGGGEGSYVVAALGEQHPESTVRFSFGRTTTDDDIDTVVSVLSEIVP